MKKIVTSLIMAVTMGACSVMGNLSIGYAMEQENDAKIASLHNPIINEKTEEVTFSYVYFGSYPKSEVSGEALMEEIIDADYVSGEAVVDGVRYRRISKNDVRTYEEWKEEHVDYNKDWLESHKELFYNWDEAGYRYFQYEPIKWKVLKTDNQKAMLISAEILDEMIYSTEVLTNRSWLQLDIGRWLNEDEENGFLEKAFVEAEQEAIVANMGIKVWLPSESDLNKYIQYYTGTKTMLTDYAFAKGGILDNKGSRYSEYWLYSNVGEVFAGYVHADGGFKTDGEKSESDSYWTKMVNDVCGIVPCITIELEKTDLWRTEAELIQQDEEKQTIVLTGDVNADKQISLEDAQLTLKSALKVIKFNKEHTIRTDIDEDGIVTLKDAQIILRKALKIED